MFFPQEFWNGAHLELLRIWSRLEGFMARPIRQSVVDIMELEEQ